MNVGRSVLSQPLREWVGRTSLAHGIVVWFCLALAALGASPVQAREWSKVRIATEGARPPFNYLDGNELAGLDVDLGRELCARMHVECVFVQQDWDGMVPGLVSSRYDAIMAAMEKTDELLKRIDFSKPYVRMPSAFLAARARQIRDPSPEGLRGRIIGVESGSAQQQYLGDNFIGSTIKPYGALEDAILDLAEGRLDLVLAEKDAIVDFMKSRREARCCKLLADVPRDPDYFGEGIAVGLRKEDPDLKALFDKALDEVLADGTFAKIRAKYFDFEIH